MPFKTRNNAGLQILEETPDYIQYICKEAVMTFAEQYVVGAYDTFMVRMRDIESSQELMRSYNISWDSQDNINLFHEINNAELDKLANTPSLLPESEDYQPLVLEGRAVPVDYDCCFTVRKDDNYSLYINDGYENLIKQDFSQAYSKDWTKNEDNSYLINTDSNITENKRYVIISTTTPNIQRITYSFKIKLENLEYNSYTVGMKNSELVWGTKVISNSQNIIDGYLKCEFIAETSNGTIGSYEWADLNIYNNGKPNNIHLKNIQVIKGNIIKPFVKTIQPNCKLDFSVDITSNTHSFILKGIPKQENKEYSVFMINTIENRYAKVTENNSSMVFSSLYQRLLPKDIDLGGGTARKTSFSLCFNVSYSNDSFSQLLIYKGSLTETELKAELAKNIKII